MSFPVNISLLLFQVHLIPLPLTPIHFFKYVFQFNIYPLCFQQVHLCCWLGKPRRGAWPQLLVHHQAVHQHSWGRNWGGYYPTVLVHREAPSILQYQMPKHFIAYSNQRDPFAIKTALILEEIKLQEVPLHVSQNHEVRPILWMCTSPKCVREVSNHWRVVSLKISPDQPPDNYPRNRTKNKTKWRAITTVLQTLTTMTLS